jgi:hypothetical protein
LAVILNPVHGAFDSATMHLWQGEGTVGKSDGQLKVGCADGRTLARISLPKISTEKRAEFAIRCALRVFQNPTFVVWATAWLSGSDRTQESAEATWAAAARAARAEAWAAEAAEAAAWAAAARTARAAAWAAEAARTARAAEAAAAAAEAAVEAAEAAIDLLAVLAECGL